MAGSFAPEPWLDYERLRFSLFVSGSELGVRLDINILNMLFALHYMLSCMLFM